MKAYQVSALMVLLLMCDNAMLIGQAYNHAEFGIKGGLNVAGMTVDSRARRNIRGGVHGGLFMKIPVTSGFSFQPEIIYSSRGVKLSYDQEFYGTSLTLVETTFRLNYIDFPLFLAYNITGGINMHLGPYVGFLLNANVDTRSEVPEFPDIELDGEFDRENFNGRDFGLSAGLEMDFGSYKFGIRYNLGLVMAAEKNSPSESFLGDAGNMVTQVYIAIRFISSR
jgi:hypothetical protein